MSEKDYYKTLGVDKSANAKEIKKAFYKKAHTCHPDKAQNEKERKEFEAKFKKLNEAYQVLSDPKKKAQYDQFGSAAFGGGAQGAGGFNWQNMRNQGGFDASNFDFGNLGDIFEDFFGGGMGSQSRRAR